MEIFYYLQNEFTYLVVHTIRFDVTSKCESLVVRAINGTFMCDPIGGIHQRQRVKQYYKATW